MFTRTLKEIEFATKFALNRPVEIRSIIAPQHFSMQSSMSTLMRAAYDLGYFASGQSYQVTTLFNGARLAYDLDNCKGYGFPPDCDVFEIDSFVLVIEYSKAYLALGFMNIADYLCIPMDVRNFPNNGEDANSGVSRN
jgi:hypothetical protein